MLSYAMVMHPMGNNAIAATPAVVKVARIRLPMPTQNLGVRRFCTPTKNEAVYVASLARLASLADAAPNLRNEENLRYTLFKGEQGSCKSNHKPTHPNVSVKP